jgi:hypothetical protein
VRGRTTRSFARLLVEIGDQVAVAGDTFGWPVTIEASYDADLGGYTERILSEFEGS